MGAAIMRGVAKLQADLPSRIGRYRVVGRLAKGGMAELFVGRLEGPHGFERPIVLKRILPHLTPDERFVEMFLEEARIIAALKHPNLIHVHELGVDADGPFIAMELLDGESLAGLCRRLAAEDELLDFGTAAAIVAHAAAGLHAAHEAKSSDGRPLQIVHRDVSPQNIFVTYDGHVYVIDFGIATTVDRICRTEEGSVRGKFEYMAPEQLEGGKLDRRADVFALGVVLFELVSGKRLYRRSSQAEMVAAILCEPPPDLTSVRPGTPPRLAEICSRALSKSPADRHATAAELRRELLAFVGQAATLPDVEEALGALMHRVFPDRIAEKIALGGDLRAGREVETLPAAEVDLAVEIPRLESTMVMAERPRLEPSARRPRVLKLASAALLLMVVTGTGVLVLRAPRGASSLDPAATTSTTSPIVVEPADEAPTARLAPTNPPRESTTDAPPAVDAGKPPSPKPRPPTAPPVAPPTVKATGRAPPAPSSTWGNPTLW